VKRARIGLAAVSFMSAVLLGCASSPPTHFYTLSAGALVSGGSADKSAAEYRVSVDPVTLPETVDRPQLVVRVGANQIVLVEEHRWAGPLKGEIRRVIAENLSQLLGAERVVTFSQNPVHHTEYRVLVDIQRFDSMVGQTVLIDALWAVRRVPDGQLRTGRSLVRESTGGEGYDALVEAHNRALAMMSLDIAEAVRLISAPPRGSRQAN
jgi:uncharacterized lipoprotein YmbA